MSDAGQIMTKPQFPVKNLSLIFYPLCRLRMADKKQVISKFVGDVPETGSFVRAFVRRMHRKHAFSAVGTE